MNNHVTLIKTVEDCIIWIKIEAGCLSLENDLFVCLCYNTPANSSRENFNDQSIFDYITNDVTTFKAQHSNISFLVTGDFNSQVSNMNDYVINEFLHNLDMMPVDYSMDIPMPRASQDKVVNDNGRLLIDFCRLQV